MRKAALRNLSPEQKAKYEAYCNAVLHGLGSCSEDLKGCEQLANAYAREINSGHRHCGRCDREAIDRKYKHLIGKYFI